MLTSKNVAVKHSTVNQFSANILKFESELRPQADCSRANSQPGESSSGSIFWNRRQFIERTRCDGNVADESWRFPVVIDGYDKPARPRWSAWPARSWPYNTIVGEKRASFHGEVGGYRLKFDDDASGDIRSFDLPRMDKLASIDSIDREGEPTYESCRYRRNCSIVSFDSFKDIQENERSYMISGAFFLAGIFVLCAYIFLNLDEQ
ncbi:MAG TPA: hypothetical protein VKS78_06770 [Roseiarcus sp.]|nr:hypothetical protein [Roseiarcus sp.]